MSTAWDFEDGELTGDVAIPTDDAAIARRRRALAPIQVLTDLERNKANLDGDFWDRYDLFNVALAVIDQVALAMGISAGRTWDETVQYARDQAGRQCPDADPAEWLAVAERVVVSLVTTEVETVPYLVLGESGPEWLAQRFWLLFLHASGAEGTEHLRASEQAINIFIGALDLDIEAAQIASEAQLGALIERGAVEAAVQAAVVAKYRSIQMLEKVRRIVAETLLDPDSHDWVTDVPRTLDDALMHVTERLTSEAAILESVADRRQHLDDAGQLAAANRVVEMLADCRHRHGELHRHLMRARSRLREALDDRFRRPARTVQRYDIARDLLGPYLGRTTRAAIGPAATVVAATGGLAATWLPTLATLTDELCAPPRVPTVGGEVADPEFDSDDTLEWWEPYEDTVDALLDAIEEPILLSQLLARSADIVGVDADGEPLDQALLTAGLVHTVHRHWAPQLAGRSAGDRIIVAVTTDGRIDRGDVTATDLLLVPGEVTVDVAAADPRSLEHVTRRLDDLEAEEVPA